MPDIDYDALHPHGSLVEQVHRAFVHDQGVDPWVLSEEIVAFVQRAAVPAPTVSDEMVERAAAALIGTVSAAPWGSVVTDVWRNRARAALTAALAAPTEEEL